MSNSAQSRSTKKINGLKQCLKQTEFEFVEQVQQDGFAGSNSDDDADAEAVTDTPSVLETNVLETNVLETNVLSLRLTKPRTENGLLVAKAKELAAVATVPQDVENCPTSSCGALLALEAALEQGVKLQRLPRKMSLKLALATNKAEQVSSNITAVPEPLHDLIKSVMRSDGLRDGVKKVTKVSPVVERLYADALMRHGKAPVPAGMGHSCDMADLLPTHTEGQASKPFGQRTDGRSNYSLPSPGLVNRTISLPSRPLSSVGMLSNRPSLRSLTVDDCTVDVVVTGRPLNPQTPSMSLTLHSHATTEGSRTNSSSRPLSTHAKPPVRLPQSPPSRRRPVQLNIGQLKDSEVTPRMCLTSSPLVIQAMSRSSSP